MTEGEDRRPHVVIVGGGFGGLTAARALRKARVRVTLVDRQNHHLFQPLLYQVAMAGLNPGDIAAPIRGIVRRQANCRVLLAAVSGVDVAQKRLLLADGDVLAYDWLILAAGATHSYFGKDAWAAHAPGLKTVAEAIEMRHRVLHAFERAEREPDPARRAAWQTFVIVGGGPTGVELAGALAELSRHTLRRDFRSFDPSTSTVLLVEAGPAILSTYTEDLRAKAVTQLQRLGVTVRCGSPVTEITGEGVRIGEAWIPARTTLWAAGVAASPLGRSLGVPLDRAGRVLVAPTLALPTRDDVLVIGDQAALVQDGKPVPGVAPAAMQAGRHAAKNVARAIEGKAMLDFRYVDKGSLATIGRAAGIADLGFIRLSGWIAWVAWLVIHIVFLIDFRSKVIVLVQWAWAWWTYKRGARLITVSCETLGADPSRMTDRSPLA